MAVWLAIDCCSNYIKIDLLKDCPIITWLTELPCDGVNEQLNEENDKFLDLKIDEQISGWMADLLGE